MKLKEYKGSSKKTKIYSKIRKRGEDMGDDIK